MPTKSTALRNSQVENLVANLDSLELKDGSSTVIATGSGISWGSPSSGAVNPSSDISLNGNANAGGGTDAATARFYDSGASGEEIDGLNVGQDQNVSTWSSGSSQQVGDKVSNVGRTFEATKPHTAGTDNEPGVGDAWPSVWDEIHILLDNTNISDGQTINLPSNSATITEPADTQ
jgi:hypothetical protein